MEPEPAELGLDVLEPKIHELEKELHDLKAQQELLHKNHNSLEEQKLVLEMGAKVYAKSSGSSAAELKERTTAQELMSLSEFSSSSK